MEEIRDWAGEAEAESPLLTLLNRLPGRDGGRWIVLPFSLVREGLRLSVSLRIFLRGTVPLFRAERLAVDCALRRFRGDREDEPRRWLFILDREGSPSSRLEIFREPPVPGGERAVLEGALRELLGPLGTVAFHDPGEGPFFGADSRDDALRSVNQEV
jgi:hypothetical protein